MLGSQSHLVANVRKQNPKLRQSHAAKQQLRNQKTEQN